MKIGKGSTHIHSLNSIPASNLDPQEAQNLAEVLPGLLHLMHTTSAILSSFINQSNIGDV